MNLCLRPSIELLNMISYPPPLRMERKERHALVASAFLLVAQITCDESPNRPYHESVPPSPWRLTELNAGLF
jgi:hypothetical protein